MNQLEREESILKIPRGHDETTALLMSDDLKSSRYQGEPIIIIVLEVMVYKDRSPKHCTKC